MEGSARRGRHLGTPDWSLEVVPGGGRSYGHTSIRAHTPARVCVRVLRVCVRLCWSISLSIYPTGITDKPGGQPGSLGSGVWPLGGAEQRLISFTCWWARWNLWGRERQGQSPAAGPGLKSSGLQEP